MKTLLLKIRSTPIALAALPADFSIFAVPPLCSNFRSKTYHSVRSYLKKVEKTSIENTTVSCFVLKTCIPCVAIPKKIEKNAKRKHNFVMFVLKSCISFVVVPKKSKEKKTLSEHTAFENSEHPYRTCGSSVCVFFLFGSFPMSVFL